MSVTASDDPPFVPFEDRTEYSDLEPIPLPPSSNEVIPIDYSDEYTSTMNYFRALYASQEISPRALKHTEYAIRLNPANYTAWFYRRRILFTLDPPDAFSTELTLLNEIIRHHEKNYQNWHHRQKLFEKYVRITPILAMYEESEESGAEDSESTWWDEEKRFLRMMLRSDAKNYHLWSYRCWLFTSFFCDARTEDEEDEAILHPAIENIRQGELAFSEELLREDLRNNSVWNYRFFLIEKTKGLSFETRLEEMRFGLELTKICPYNESGWNYIAGMWDFRKPYEGCDRLRDLLREMIIDFVDLKKLEWQARSVKYTENIHSSYVLLRIYLDENRPERIEVCLELLEMLKVEDPIRTRFWDWMKERVLRMGTAGRKEGEEDGERMDEGE